MSGGGNPGAGGGQTPMPPMPPAGGGNAAAAAGGGNPGGASPAASPMVTPQRKEGKIAAAQTNVHIAVNMLEEALPAFGSESPEGATIIKALGTLAKLMGKKGQDSSDLVPAEVKQMVASMPQMGGGTDIQRQILQMMQHAGAQKPGMPPGGGAPQPMPAPAG